MNKDYRHTLNLPKTSFNMKANLPANEPRILEFWQKENIYEKLQKKHSRAKSYILHDGPPYANGHIHIGHVLNKSLKDIVVKFKSMQGLNCPFIPGWDCHGLPVEHQLFKELGITKENISVVDFRKRAKDYALKFVDIQKQEFKRLGIFAHWQSPYLTLNSEYEAAILDVFLELFKKGFIYRGLKPVNWCFKCETALAEAEVEYEDKLSESVFVKFDIKKIPQRLEKKFLLKGESLALVIWTTTPWTLPANVAVAMRADSSYSLLKLKNNQFIIVGSSLVDKFVEITQIQTEVGFDVVAKISGKDLAGGICEHPLVEIAKKRDIKILEADFVDMSEGTGFVHIAPGHGQDDFKLASAHKLDTVMSVDEKGRFTSSVGIDALEGKNVFEANELIIKKLRDNDKLIFNAKLEHSYPHCWRCKGPIIFRATQQWFLSIDHNGLRQKLESLVSNQITWIPASGRERISAMIEQRPDWCLSRQRYWGVPIPALKCLKCKEEFLDANFIKDFIALVRREGSDVWFIKDYKQISKAKLSCPHCKSQGLNKCGDILDVWFDSGASFEAVLRKRKELSFPAQLYLEGSDQHRGWFQASLVASVAKDGRRPFDSVLTHGFVVDEAGRKMSKSLGNVVSPHEVIEKYGADILRLWVASSDYHFDVRVSEQILARLCEGYRKIRNTLRFILGNISDFNPAEIKIETAELSPLDAWAISRLDNLIQVTTRHYDNFDFYKAYQEIYNFCSFSLSSFYLDVLKDLLYTSNANSQGRKIAQAVLYQMLVNLTKLIAPILSFTAEEVWAILPGRESESVFLSSWPQIHKDWRNLTLEEDFAQILGIRDLVMKALEVKRSEGVIGSSLEASLSLEIEKESDFKLLDKFHNFLATIFIVSQVSIKKSRSFVIDISKAKGEKCLRCWNYSESVGEDKDNPDICKKCSDTLK